MYVFFYLIEQHSQFLLHTVQVLYMCTLCDSTDINTIIEFVPHVSGDGFNGGSDSYFWGVSSPLCVEKTTSEVNISHETTTVVVWIYDGI